MACYLPNNRSDIDQLETESAENLVAVYFEYDREVFMDYILDLHHPDAANDLDMAVDLMVKTDGYTLDLFFERAEGVMTSVTDVKTKLLNADNEGGLPYAFSDAFDLSLSNHHTYGSDRMGIIKHGSNVEGPVDENTPAGDQLLEHYAGMTRFEIKDHLGNVRSVLSERKKRTLGTTGTAKSFDADVIEFNDYYPYGAPMDLRSESYEVNVELSYEQKLTHMGYEWVTDKTQWTENFPSMNTGPSGIANRTFHSNYNINGKLAGWNKHTSTTITGGTELRLDASSNAPHTGCFQIHYMPYTGAGKKQKIVLEFDVQTSGNFTPNILHTSQDNTGARHNNWSSDWNIKKSSIASGNVVHLTIEGYMFNNNEWNVLFLGFIPNTGVSGVSDVWYKITNIKYELKKEKPIYKNMATGFEEVTNSGYRYGFNGMERDDEVKGSGNSYDFGARIFDPRLGRWLSTDPLQADYPFASPYNFALNTPIQAYDPDGRLVIFVNGYNGSKAVAKDYFDGTSFFRSLGRLFSTEQIWNNDKNDYWGGLDNKFMERIGDNNAVYADASSHALSTAAYRESRGKEAGEALLKKIDAGDVKVKAGESIKLVSHSQGGAYANGMAKVLVDAGYNVEVSYNVAPKQLGDINTPSEVGRVVQYSSPSDFIAPQTNMSGAENINNIVPDSEQGVTTGGGHTAGSYHDGNSSSAGSDKSGIFSIPQGSPGAVEPRKDNP